jgi:pyruvate,orthophosphate dikinase
MTTEACNAFLDAGEVFPPGLWDQELSAIRAIEAATNRWFGVSEAPLLVSCRSGSKFSMPGMMDTILNLGMNDEVTDQIAARTGDGCFAFDLYRRLIQMFGTVVFGVPDDLFEASLAVRREAAGVKKIQISRKKIGAS